MPPRQLTKNEYSATFTSKMHDVTETAQPVVDIWPYVESVPASDLEEHTIYDNFVEVVYQSDDDAFQHVLVMTKTKNVYFVVVIDLVHVSIYGHRLLDLNREYGLT